MRLPIVPLLLTLAIHFALPDAGRCQEQPPAPWQDDAPLHAVQMVGPARAWAVGDCGTIWHTADSGAHWSLQASGVDCPLRAVFFLTDRVGWVAGGETSPALGNGRGVVLATTDGGATWHRLAPPDQRTPEPNHSNNSTRPQAGHRGVSLPPLSGIRFGNLEDGIAWGEPSPQAPSGVFRTADGGVTWQPIPGNAGGEWFAGDFSGPDTGVVAGPNGRLRLVSETGLVASRLNGLGLRGIYQVRLPPRGPGWLVGDGGLVLKTDTHGLVWEAPQQALPPAARKIFDFRALAVRGPNVFLAGRPGSVVWHSPDAGQTWVPQPTQSPLPIAALSFATDQVGCAVGALGSILWTNSAGRTWTPVRGADRRLALLAFPPRAADCDWLLPTQLAGQDGFRCGTTLLAREPSDSRRPSPRRLAEAMSQVRGSHCDQAWQFPLEVEGLDRDPQALADEWNRRSEGEFEQRLLWTLITELRMWRPSVVILHKPRATDGLARLLYTAQLKALELAADSTAALPIAELAELPPWKVARVFERLPQGSAGHVHLDPWQYLPRLGQPTLLAAQAATVRVGLLAPWSGDRVPYRLINDSAEARPPASIFAGLLAPAAAGIGDDARRTLPPLSDSDLEHRLAIARQQKNFASYFDRFGNEPRHAAQLIGQIPQLVQHVPPDQAAWQLAALAESYRRTGQWELWEQVLVELVDRYPHQQAAATALASLARFWGSAEANWRRIGRAALHKQRRRTLPEITLASVAAAEEQYQRDRAAAEAGQIPSALPPPAPPVVPADQITEHELERRSVPERFSFWENRARQAIAGLEQHHPAAAATPDIQFLQATLDRCQSQASRADAIYRAWFHADADRDWPLAAAGELWLTRPVATGPRLFATCRATPTRPQLDGLLSDLCWQDADELTLIPQFAASTPSLVRLSSGLALLARDDRHLYLAASLPILPGQTRIAPQKTGRTHDADVEDFDHLTLLVDLDRDFSTAFRFTVDQRGCTAEACCEDPTWNPRWFVAVSADESHWRLEVAIPLDQLQPAPPAPGDVWNIGLVRTIPGSGLQSWTSTRSPQPAPDTFGYLHFE